MRRVLSQQAAETSINFVAAEALARLVLERDAICLAHINSASEGAESCSLKMRDVQSAFVAPAIWHVRSWLAASSIPNKQFFKYCHKFPSTYRCQSVLLTSAAYVASFLRFLITSSECSEAHNNRLPTFLHRVHRYLVPAFGAFERSGRELAVANPGLSKRHQKVRQTQQAYLQGLQDMHHLSVMEALLSAAASLAHVASLQQSPSGQSSSRNPGMGFYGPGSGLMARIDAAADWPGVRKDQEHLPNPHAVRCISKAPQHC